MKEFFKEYGSIILAVTGTMAFFGALWNPLFSPNGMVAQLIRLWCGNGC